VRTIQKKIPEFNKSLTGKVPGRTVINKYKREVLVPNLGKMEKTGMDEPWSIASMSAKSEFELPSEVIPVVLEIKRIRNKDLKAMSDFDVIARVGEFEDKINKIVTLPSENKNKLLEGLKEGPGLFTVREAKLVARIYYELKDRNTIKEIERWAHHCSEVERDCELAGVKYDSTDTEFGMSFGDISAYAFWKIKMFSGQDDLDIGEIFVGEGFNKFKDLGFTPYGLSLFGIWFYLTTSGGKFKNFTEEEIMDWYDRLRAWVLKQEPVEEFNCPKELLGEIEYVTPWGSDLGIRTQRTQELEANP